MPGKPWTEDERQFIRDHYLTMSCGEMAAHLPGRSERAVQHEFASMGLERPQPKEGDTLGRLKILRLYQEDIGTQKRTMTDVECVCGTKKNGVRLTAMVQGKTVSCGCWKAEKASERMSDMNTTHGMSHTPLYRQWAAMKTRATNPNFGQAKDYSGRGIGLCEEWLSFEPFYEWAMANGYQEGLELDRKDNNLGYSPANCRWATEEVQQNNRRSNKRVVVFGESKTFAEWSRDIRCVVSEHAFWERVVKLHWEPERALVTPAGPQGNRSRSDILTGIPS